MTGRIFFERGKLKASFAWYDLWVGAYIDWKKKILYFCLFPTLLLTIDFGKT